MTCLGMVLKGYPRISETFIAGEILGLERLGARVRIFSMRHPREDFHHRMIERIQARVDYLPSELLPDLARLLRPNVLLAAAAPARYRRALALARVRHGRSRSLATLKHLLQAGFLVRRLMPLGEPVGHLHAHFAHSPASVALFAATLSGLPFSFTAHAKDIYTSRPEQLAEKIRLARFVATCTRYNLEHLRALAPEADTPLACVYHGIDIRRFAFQEPVPRPDPPWRVLTVARLCPKKGIFTVIRALGILRGQGERIAYTLIGDGDLRERVLEAVGACGLAPDFRFLGTQAQDRVMAEMRAAHCFALGCEIAPDGDRDGIPNVLVESLAMGLPAAGTRVSGLPEIIGHGRTGLLVEPGDAAGLAAAIRRLCTDADLRQRLARAGRARVEAEFDNRRLIHDLAALFREHGALPGRPGR